LLIFRPFRRRSHPVTDEITTQPTEEDEVTEPAADEPAAEPVGDSDEDAEDE
jgi:hypothetical protein